MPLLHTRFVSSCALLLTLEACSSSDSGDLVTGDDASLAAPPEVMDGSVDAALPLRDSGPVRDATPAPVDAAPRDAAGDAADSGLVFELGYGPCPAPLSCDPFIYFIANDLIRKEFADAPANVSACIQPNLPIAAVPACYAPGPCAISDEVGICLGMEEPHPTTGYCIKPCT